MDFNVDFNALAESAQSAARQKTVVNRSGEPRITFSSMRNKMSISSGAINLMGIDKDKDDTIILYDFGVEAGEKNGFRFATSKGYIKDGKVKGTTIGDSNQFSYSGIWARGIYPDLDFDPVSKPVEEMAKLGLLTIDPDNERSVKADKIVTYDVEEIRDANGELIDEVPVDKNAEGELITVKLYALVNRTERERPTDSEDEDED
jgi:hypothetical protein